MKKSRDSVDRWYMVAKRIRLLCGDIIYTSTIVVYGISSVHVHRYKINSKGNVFHIVLDVEKRTLIVEVPKTGINNDSVISTPVFFS